MASDAGSGGEPRCPVCGTPHRAGDRYCAQCGAALQAPDAAARPLAAPAIASIPDEEGEAAAAPPAKRDENAAWLFAARPLTVIGGGFLLLLLATALLAIGQRDDTGTIVMASICLTPLALLTVVIGLARLVVSREPGAGSRE